MPDDLSNLAPTDPSNVDPHWRGKRQSILDDVLAADAPRRPHAWQWVAGVAAVSLVAVAVGGVVQQLRPEPHAIPASPITSPTPSISAGEDPPGAAGPVVAALGTLLDTGTGITICNGHVTDSSPPQCPFTTPVMGITWDDVPWAETAQASIPETAKSITWGEALIVGNFDGDTFINTQVFPRNAPAIPLPPDTITDEELPTLCEAPIRGPGGDSVEALIETADGLPGYQALWVSTNQVTYNVAVTEDVEGARSALAEVYGGELCVGTVDGPTEQALQDADLALEPLRLDVDSATTAAGSVWSTFSSISTRGNRIEVYVERDTPELLDQIESAVGAKVWSYTDVIPFFYPLGASPTPEPTPAISLEPSTPVTSSFTAEQRDWAEKTVADILGAFGQPGTPDVTARMARVTYAEYMSVWNIDIPGTPEPPADDTEILVIALSAPLDGSRGPVAAPFLGTPDPTVSLEPQEPIGTLSVRDPATGENLSHVVILGGDPPANRITELPGPIEDVTLPEGFR